MTETFKVIVPYLKTISDSSQLKLVSYPASGFSLYTREQAITIIKRFYQRRHWREGDELECWAEAANELGMSLIDYGSIKSFLRCFGVFMV